LKKLLVLLLSVVVAGGAFAEGQTEMAAGEPITITHMTEICFNWPETTPPLLEEMNALLGVNWVHIPCPGGNGSYRPKLQVLFAANDLPDLFETYWIEQLIQQGTSDLSLEEVAEHMPSYYEGISAFTDSIGADLDASLDRFRRDGVLKHYPMIWSSAADGHGYLWRKDYLDELGMDVPHTLEEWEAVFAAYKEAYPDRYAYGARCHDTTLYRCFNAATNAFGLSNSRYLKKDGKLVFSNAQPEMIQVLEVLARWYEMGYLDPEFVTVNGESEPFDSGVAIMKGWEHPNFPFDDDRFHNALKEHTPDAEFALTGPPRVEGFFPATYAWQPMHGNGHGIARHNNDDRDRVHAIMGAVEQISQRDNAFLTHYGIEGTHWSGVENNRPVWTEEFKDSEARQGMGFNVNSRSTAVGYWAINDFKRDPGFINPVQEDWVAQVRFDPDSALGANNVCMLTQSFVSALDEDGNDLRAAHQDLLNESVALFGQIILGQKPVSAYQEWLDRWNAGPGPEIEAAATRMWGHLVSECPSA
jgi:ABC-type glycerol-3-phosphate transport system substrate-binding protein